MFLTPFCFRLLLILPSVLSTPLAPQYPSPPNPSEELRVDLGSLYQNPSPFPRDGSSDAVISSEDEGSPPPGVGPNHDHEHEGDATTIMDDEAKPPPGPQPHHDHGDGTGLVTSDGDIFEISDSLTLPPIFLEYGADKEGFALEANNWLDTVERNVTSMSLAQLHYTMSYLNVLWYSMPPPAQHVRQRWYMQLEYRIWDPEIGVVHSISREITKLLDREQQQQNGDDHVRISSPLTEDG